MGCMYFIVIIVTLKDPFTEMCVAHALVWFCEIVRFRVSSSILVKMVASFAPTHSADPVTLYGSDPLHSNLAAS